MNRMKLITAFGITLLILITFSPGYGAGTIIWDLASIETWLQGDFEGTGLTSRGEIIPTVQMNEHSIPARLAWGAVSTPSGALVTTSLPASVIRISNGDTQSLIQTDDLGFTAITVLNDEYFAAASPSGRVFKYSAENDSMVHLATAGDSYIWTMIPNSDRSVLYLGTGPNGNIYQLDPDGALEKLGTLPGPNVMSLTIYEDSLYAGDDQGGLFKYGLRDKSPSKLEPVYGFSDGEISSLASDDRYLYVAVNQKQAMKGDGQKQQDISQLAQQLRQESLHQKIRHQIKDERFKRETIEATGPIKPEEKAQSRTMLQAIREASRQQQSQLFAGLTGNLVYRMDPPGEMNIVYNDPEEIILDLEADNEILYIASGGKGRLYKVLPDFTRVAYFESSQPLILDVVLKNGQPELLTTGEGASLLTREMDPAVSPRYRSTALDGQLLSMWGTLKWSGNEPVRVRTRSGNSSTPDTGWNTWSKWYDANEFTVPSKASRYLQFELEFPARESRLKNLQVAYSIPNQRPQIANIQVSPNPNRTVIPYIATRRGPQQSSGNGQQHPTGGPQAHQQSTAQRQINWEVIDPDGDRPSYKLYYRPEGHNQWISFTGENYIEETSFTWTTSDYSDGWYELKLVADDRPENPPGRGYSAEQLFGPILVDNTSPDFEDIRFENSKLAFSARDDVSWITGARYRTNGEKWQDLLPTDGIFDEPYETFLIDLPAATNDKLIELSITDEGGNQALTRPVRK